MVRSIIEDSRCAAGVAAILAVVLLLGASGRASAETPRERCRSMTAWAPRADAIAACDELVKGSGSAEDMWAAAEVRVARPETPTMDDLIRADLLAAAATRLAPGEAWGYLARFDIARRWGDPLLVDRRLDELQRVAPADPKTLHAEALVRPTRSWGLVLGWCALLLAFAATAAHAAYRPLRRRLGRGPTRAPATLLIALAASLLLGHPGRAAAAAFPIDDADPELGVPTPAEADARPLDFGLYLQDLTERADVATRRGDHAAAVRYYRALAHAVPDSSIPQQRLCDSLVALGDPDAALLACRTALALPGVRVEDFVRFGDLVLAKETPTSAELADVEAVAGHLAAQPASRATGLVLERRVLVLLWARALAREQIAEARRMIDEARAAGLAEDSLARLEAATAAHGHVGRSRRLLLVGAGIAAFVLGLGLVGLIVWGRRGRRNRPRRQWTTTVSGSV